jgi:hypothetical protein
MLKQAARAVSVSHRTGVTESGVRGEGPSRRVASRGPTRKRGRVSIEREGSLKPS